MKQILFTLCLAFTSIGSFGQNNGDSTGLNSQDKPIYRNEFGIDATGFIQKFLTFKESDITSPYYYLTYRRHFRKGNLRAAVGGNFYKGDINPSLEADDNTYYRRSYSAKARIGWEFFSELGKRWQIFYGLDFMAMYSYAKNDAETWQYGYVTGSQSKTTTYGIAPMAGFRFRITPRLSLSAETSLSLTFEGKQTNRFYTAYPAVVNQPGANYPDYFTTPKMHSIYTAFTQPLSIFLTFDI